MVRPPLFPLFALIIACGINTAHAQGPITEIITVNVLDGYTEDPVENAEVKLYKDGYLVDTGTTSPAGEVLFTVQILPTSVDQEPTRYIAILPAYPNPFSGSTSIPFSIDKHTRITAEIYDLLGRQVAMLQQFLPVGKHELGINMSGLTPGLNFLRLLDSDRLLGVSTLVKSGPGSLRTPPSISIQSRSSSSNTVLTPAGKTATPGSSTFEIEISRPGYATRKYSLTIPTDLIFTALLHPLVNSNSIGMVFKYIPSGTFDMGYEGWIGWSYCGPVHAVTLTHDFYIGFYEVTQAEYDAVVNSNPSYFFGDNFPVETVVWKDAIRFANALSISEGYAPCYDQHGIVIDGGYNPYECEGYRLLMEAEWEYAARAGTTTFYSFGDNESDLDSYAWHPGNAGNETHPVGRKLPNPWGLYDIHGNVDEWVFDVLDSYPDGPTEDPTGQVLGGSRGVRGGSWLWSETLPSAARSSEESWRSFSYLGFRLARTAR